MSASHRCFDLDMAQVGDEELVVLAKECEFLPARDELLVRFHDFSNGVVRAQARGRGLTSADIEDAEQDAVFWLVEAIECYDTRQLGIRRGCTFRTFLYRVVTARFLDFVKHLLRLNRRCGALVDGEDAIAAVGVNGRWKASSSLLPEPHMWASCVDDALDTLDPADRDLWRQLVSGLTLRQISARTGVSYETLKHRKRKLLTMMIVCVRKALQQRCGESP